MKKIHAINGKQLSGRGGYEFLELGWRIRRQRLPLQLAPVPAAETSALRRSRGRRWQRSAVIRFGSFAARLQALDAFPARGGQRIRATAGSALLSIDGIVPNRILRIEPQGSRQEYKQHERNNETSSHRCTLSSWVLPSPQARSVLCVISIQPAQRLVGFPCPCQSTYIPPISARH